MNPIAKCCGFYCAFLMILGVFFNLILIAMIAAGSEFLTANGVKDEKMYALGGACVVNVILMAACCICVRVGMAKEAREAHEREEQEKRELEEMLG